MVENDIIEYAKSMALDAANKGLFREEYLNRINRFFSAEVIKAADIALANTISDEVIDKCVEMQQFCIDNETQALTDVVKDTIGKENFNKLVVLGAIIPKWYGGYEYVWWDSKADMNIGKLKYYRDKEKAKIKK